MTKASKTADDMLPAAADDEALVEAAKAVLDKTYTSGTQHTRDVLAALREAGALL